MNTPASAMRAAAAAVGLLCASLGFGKPFVFDGTRMTDAAQDGDGRVWAIQEQEPGGLLRWEGDRWGAAQLPGAVARLWPVTLGAVPGGEVYCLWRAENSDLSPMTYWVSRHRGDLASEPVRFRAPPGEMAMHVDSQGHAWLLHATTNIFRLGHEEVALAYSVGSNGFRASLHGPSPVNRLLAVSDAKGQSWFWSDTVHPYEPGLFGLLVYDGRQFVPTDTLAGFPESSLGRLFVKDAQTLWAAFDRAGLYEVDIAQRRAQPVTRPAWRGVEHVRRMIPVRTNVWFAYSHARSWRVDDAAERSTVVYEGDLGLNDLAGRTWLHTAEGCWIGTRGQGVLFLPADGGPARLLGIRQAVALQRVDRLFQLGDGTLLLVGCQEGAQRVAPSVLLTPQPWAKRVEPVAVRWGVLADSRGHVWATLNETLNALSEWDGEQWTPHEPPFALSRAHLTDLAMDTRGRVWLRIHVTRNDERGAAIYDPATDAWEEYPTYRDALAAQRQQPPGFRLRSCRPFPNTEDVAFSPPDRVAHLGQDQRLAYYDGQRWREWPLTGVFAGRPMYWPQRVLYTPKGRLAVVAGKPGMSGDRALDWTEDNGWRSLSPAGLQAIEPQGEADPPAPPPGSVTTRPDSLVRDVWGGSWLLWRHQLYRAGWGKCLPQFAPEEIHPFEGAVGLTDVALDIQGNAFLRTTGVWGGPGCYLLRAPMAPPDTRLTVDSTSDDSVELRLETTGPGVRWCRWRIGEGAWSTPGSERTVRLNWLTNGVYRVEAQAIDEQLQVDPTPARQTLTIEADPTRRTAALVQALGAADYSTREEAVRALVARPALAVPALRAARPAANEDLRWWIDSALQQIQSAGRSP